MSAIEKAMQKCRANERFASDFALQLKGSGVGLGFLDQPNPVSGLINQFQGQSANQRKYAVYKGWVYSAIHAIATEASKQPVVVGRMGKKPTVAGTKSVFIADTKYLSDYIRNKMPLGLRSKTATDEMEILTDHRLVKILDKPNPIQYKSSFVYSFVANLCLTGWAYIVAGVGKNGEPEFYSLPTSWVIPLHTKGAFSEFKIVDPKNPTSEGETLDRSQVTFAYMPNPADPLSAYAPVTAQMQAVKIDECIQTSQGMFFENGLFPGAIVTVGKNPHPDVPGGVRPRLSPAQRRQVYAAIRKVSSGVANYGNPVILDGMIESIERLSATQNEMGWEKSEDKVRTRILSSFGVHPFILGEQMAGSYAQAFIVQDRFCQRVNVFLDMLSTIMSSFAPEFVAGVGKKKAKEKDRNNDSNVVVWWEEAAAKDYQMEQSRWDAARNRDDVSQNEYRGYMGLPPDEDRNPSVINKTSVQPIAAIAAQVKKGELEPEQAIEIFKGMGLPDDMAKKIAGDGPSEEEKQQAQQQAQQGGFGQQGMDQQNQDEEWGDYSSYGGDEAKQLSRVLQKSLESLQSIEDVIRLSEEVML